MNDKVLEARRALFEQEYSKLDQQATAHLLFVREDGQYGYHTTRVAWACFNAALDAVEIELPKRAYTAWHNYDQGFNDAVSASCAAIESTNLGLRVKL